MPRILASVDNSSNPVNSVGPASTSSRYADRSAVRLLAGGRVGLGALPLLGHQAAEALFVDAQAGFSGHLQGQLEREAVGVVQRERVGSGQHRVARLLRRVGGLLEQPRTRRQRAVERRLLRHRDALDPVEIVDQLRI